MQTYNYAEFVASLAKPLPTNRDRFNHAILGIIGEIGEIADCWKKHIIYEQALNEDNMLEELGDLQFYIQMLLNEPGFYALIDYEHDYDYNYFSGLNCGIEETLFRMVGHVSDIAADFARHERSSMTYWLLITFHYLCVRMQYSEEDVIAYNMQKLRKRYPNNQFSIQYAKERLDKVNA